MSDPTPPGPVPPVVGRRWPGRSRQQVTGLTERSTVVGGVDVFYRESTELPDAPVMMHLHGFGLSGRYLLPTAELLCRDFRTFVSDLPGFGRSGRGGAPLEVPEMARAAAAFLDDRGIERVTMVGNSMGCPVICEFAHLYPDRLERAVLDFPGSWYLRWGEGVGGR